MAQVRERAGLRSAAVVVAFPVVVAVSTAILHLAGRTELDGVALAAYLVPVAAFGAFVARAWALVLPLAWGAVFVAALRVSDLITGDCSVCTSERTGGTTRCSSSSSRWSRSPSRSAPASCSAPSPGGDGSSAVLTERQGDSYPRRRWCPA